MTIETFDIVFKCHPSIIPCKCCGHFPTEHIYQTEKEIMGFVVEDVERFAGCHTLINDNAYGCRVITYGVCSCKGYEQAF